MNTKGIVFIINLQKGILFSNFRNKTRLSALNTNDIFCSLYTKSYPSRCRFFPSVLKDDFPHALNFSALVQEN